MRLDLDIPIIVKNISIVSPDGSIEIDLLLDTGSVFTAISWSILKIIGYDPAIVTERQEIVTANGVIEAPILSINEIIIGDIQADNFIVICNDIPDLTGVSGVLGLSFLQNFRTIIDFKQGYLEISWVQSI